MYRIEDMEQITANIDKIKYDAVKEYKTFYEPTLKENADVYKLILEYIKKKEKVIYGGYAQNILLMSKNPNETIYTEIDGVFFNWPDIADIEFYSPTPIEDVIELTEFLHSKNLKYVEGKEGIHNDTYKIFVNFINYCDITYISKNIYDNLPIITVNGIKCVSPHFMMVDAYRVITDPLTSYWRLDKSLNRFQKLIKYYPIDETKNSTDIKFDQINDKIYDEILLIIRKRIIQQSKLIVVGLHAFNYYVKKDSENYLIKKIPYYEAISSKLDKDSKKIYNKLQKFNITVKKFYPFFSFMDERVEFYYNEHLIFKLYGNNQRCTVYTHSKKKKTYFGTYNLVLMYLLFNYFYSYINRNKSETIINSLLIGKLFESRKNYLNNRNITVIDKSPFQDFTYKCLGKPHETIRESYLKLMEKKKQGKRLKFSYTPSGKHGQIPEFKFNNISGNLKK
jgi:hypothetical protein